ncbi:NAD(P)-dependent oxidoreductase [Streptomyces sp. NPDC026672]|uniref:NAD-dependent epimerase/dehydratase family protein n=1 Tax=unclassified Streptomyces TaxID=2593676 RepID=UPI0033F31E5E
MRSERRPVTGRSVVVLGGTGFLGRRIGAAYAADGARVRLVSRSAAAVPAVAVGPGVSAVGLDLVTASPREIAALLATAGADVVVNAAGRAWQADEAELAAGNTALVERVVAALAALPGPPVRLVQLGTVHEYGAGAPDAATGEDHEPAPVTPYGRTKLAGTRAVLRARREHGVDGVVLRLANVIGAGVPEGSLFGRIAAHLGAAARAGARGEKAAGLRLPALRAARDLVDARDVTAAVLAAGAAPEADVAGRVINVGRGTAVPMRALVDRMIELSGLELPVAEAAEGPGARTDVARQCLDVSRAWLLLGWRPLHTLDDSLRELLASVMPPEHPRPGTPLGITAGAPAEEGTRS